MNQNVNAPRDPRLPRENLRDYINELRLDIKFRYVPFRGYYRYRAHKYMTRIDPEMGILRFLVDPHKACLDVGANLGLFSYYLSRMAPRVYAFEPNPLPLRVLRYVVDDNVEVHHMALSDTRGDVELVIPKGRKGWSSNGAAIDKQTDAPRVIKVRVKGLRIDDLDKELNTGTIGFIKIDVEGHEKSVLEGARETLARDRPNLFIENEHSHAGDEAHNVFTLLDELDYDGYFIEEGILRNIRHFSVEEHQLKPRRGQSDRPYVKNFIFLPR